MSLDFSEKYLVDQLREGICKVVFKKANGQERVMICTLAEEIIPLSGSSSAPQEDCITVFDVEAEAWRAFKPSKLISFEKIDA